MTSFDLGAFEAAFPPTGISAPGYGAAAPMPRPVAPPPGTSQHITVLNMSGKPAAGSWTTEHETTHFTIADGHVFNLIRRGVVPIRTIEIHSGGPAPLPEQPIYSDSRVMPIATIAIVLNRGGGYSPLSSIDGGGGGGYEPPANGGGDGGGGGYGPSSGSGAVGYGPAAGNGQWGGYVPPPSGGFGAAYPTPSGNNNDNAPMSYSPFGWRV